MLKLDHSNPLSAVLSGISDLFDKSNQEKMLPEYFRVEGKKILITGANSGLGYAVAEDLALRGAHLTLACRSGIPETAHQLKHKTGNQHIKMVHVDLADLSKVQELANIMADQGEEFDVVILNAGLMPQQARKSSQGYDIMYAVHFLANRLLVSLMLEKNLVRRARTTKQLPGRIVFVSSEAHRSAKPVDFAKLGQFTTYGIRDGMGWYGQSKLILNTYANWLSGKLSNRKGRPEINVFYMCPGPVNSNIARETPAWLAPIIKPTMDLMFPEPKQAAKPVVYLACNPTLSTETGVYMHMKKRKKPDSFGLQEKNARRLIEISDQQLSNFL